MYIINVYIYIYIYINIFGYKHLYIYAYIHLYIKIYNHYECIYECRCVYIYRYISLIEWRCFDLGEQNGSLGFSRCFSRVSGRRSTEIAESESQKSRYVIT